MTTCAVLPLAVSHELRETVTFGPAHGFSILLLCLQPLSARSPSLCLMDTMCISVSELYLRVPNAAMQHDLHAFSEQDL